MPRLIWLSSISLLLALLHTCDLFSPATGTRTPQTTFYVATNGNDRRSGTEKDPFRTIQHALDKATVPGSTIYVRAGTYRERLHFPASGSAGGGFITLSAYPRERPLLSGQGTRGENMIAIDGKSYVRVQGLEIAHAAGIKDGSAIAISGSGSHIEIKDNSMHDMHADAAFNCGGAAGGCARAIGVFAYDATPVSQLTISNNDMYDVQPGNGQAVQLIGNISDFQVTYNKVHDAPSIAIDAQGGYTDHGPVRSGVIAHNTVYNIKGAPYGGNVGIYIDGAHDILVDSNMVHDSEEGIVAVAEIAGWEATGITVQNNILYNNKDGLRIGTSSEFGDNGGGLVVGGIFRNNTLYNNGVKPTSKGFGSLSLGKSRGCRISNNIFYGGTNELISYLDANDQNTLDHNVYYAPAGDAAQATFVWQGTTYTGLAAFQRASGQDAHSLFADPQFVNAARAQFELRANSPASEAGGGGNAQDYAQQDFTGGKRQGGRNVSPGAFEGR